MEFDSKMISIIGVVLVISMGYFIYLIYIDVLNLKSQVDEIKNSLLTNFDEDEDYEEEEDEEEDEYDEDENQYDDVLEVISEEDESEAEVKFPVELPVPSPLSQEITPDDHELTNTSLKPRKKRVSKTKKQPILQEVEVKQEDEQEVQQES